METNSPQAGKEPFDIWASWLLRRRYGNNPNARQSLLQLLHPVRVKLLNNARVSPGQTVLDVGTGDGFVGFEALRQLGDSGSVIFYDPSGDMLEVCKLQAQHLGRLGQCRFVTGTAEDLRALDENACDAITMRCVLIYVSDKARVFREFHRVLKTHGRFSIYEPVNRLIQDFSADRFWGYDVGPVKELAARVLELYRKLQGGDQNTMVDFDDRDLWRFAESAGFSNITLELRIEAVPSPPPRDWNDFACMSPNPKVPTFEEAIKQVLNPDEQEELISHLKPRVQTGSGLPVKTAHVYLCGQK